MNGFDAIAASLTDLANWSEDELAAHRPPKWVAQQAAERTKHIAFMAALTAKGKLTPEGLAGILRGDQGDGDTLTLGHAGLQPSGHRVRRAVWYLRRRVAAVAWGTGVKD